MLVLSRKKAESTDIDGNITVTIVRVSGDKVRIGITAPANIEVHRSEVIERIHKSKEVKDE